MANAMLIHMVKTALYSIIIQFDEETIQLMWVMYTTKVFKDIENLAIILVPLIMILSRGHTGQIKGSSLLGDYDFLTGDNKVVPWRD